MVKVRLTAPYPLEVLGVARQPGEEFDCPEEQAADLCRSGRPFERAERAKPGRSGAAADGGD